MCADPEDGETAVVPFVELGERRQVDEAIPTRHDQPVGPMLVDQAPDLPGLHEQRPTRVDAGLDLERRPVGGGDRVLLGRSAGLRRKPLEQPNGRSMS